MANHGQALLFICSVLAAAGLVLLSVSLHGTSVTLGSTLQTNSERLVQSLRSELLASANAADHISNSLARATNLHALIRPADFVSTPVITATPTPASAATIPAAPTAPVASAQTVSLPSTPRPLPANTYAWGNCTWWAAARRAQIGDAIPGNWGNAASWAVRASRDGYQVDHTPTPGAIMQTPYSAGGLGHVAIVEQVDANGSWHISEMNVLGLNIVDHAVRSRAAAANFNFIHDK